MEAINGISFEDWAAACAHLAQGMPENEVLSILGVELPVWQEATDQWASKLGDLMAEDMNIATTYSQIFANPKVGKFAQGAENVQSGGDLLALVPDWETYQKIFSQLHISSEHGIDSSVVLEEYGLDLGKWGAVGTEYMNTGLNSLDHNAPNYKEKYDYYNGVMAKWENHWREHYKNQSVDLSGDIDF